MIKSESGSNAVFYLGFIIVICSIALLIGGIYLRDRAMMFGGYYFSNEFMELLMITAVVGSGILVIGYLIPEKNPVPLSQAGSPMPIIYAQRIQLPNGIPAYCPNCGAQREGGNFCKYCGMRYN